ncbi:MAG: hypothetical protein CFH41_00980 [Alphaproteobacteria bacterium MarineAlpha11_Bin1]|nr:MAG: hypothetical protein CFH41_00980 [Alphaproteobacteria bacterium MarineAlpha11_Bin1]|tara:strand:- start:1171 stop:2070 length:900 start_codon:yes stop_codon:yes gene_type:complete
MPKIRIGTSERGGTFWTEGKSIATLFKRDYGIDPEIIDASQASIENAKRLDAGLIELGFMASNWIGCAYRGDHPFNKPIDIRMVAPANSGAMFFITQADSDLKYVRDLVGKRVSIGPKGSGMVQHIHTIFGALDISFSDFEPVYLSFLEGSEAIKNGYVDAQWQCPYPNVIMDDISQQQDVRVLDYSPADLKTIFEKVEFYRLEKMPGGLFRGLDKNTDQVAVINVVGTHARTDPEIVRQFVTTMLNNLEELAVINPLFIGLDRLFEPIRLYGKAAIEFGGVHIHPGALDAYRDKGYLS